MGTPPGTPAPALPELGQPRLLRVGIMGGTFDPVHLGHLIAAEACREQLNLDELRFVPAAISPFKLRRQPAEARHRVTMLQLATSGHPSFVVDDREIRRGGTSYTVDTLRELKAELTGTQLVFLMGADALADFDKWREPAEICRLAQVVVVVRGGQAAPDLQVLARFLPPGHEPAAALVRMPQCEISSSALRAAVAGSRSIRYQVPSAVLSYIAEHGLYRG